MNIPTTRSYSSTITMIDESSENQAFTWSIKNFKSILNSEDQDHSIGHQATEVYPMTTSNINAHVVTGDTQERKSIWMLYLYTRYGKGGPDSEVNVPYVSLHLDHSNMSKAVRHITGTASILTSHGGRENDKTFQYVNNTWDLSELEFFIVQEDLIKDPVNLQQNGTLTIRFSMSIWYKCIRYPQFDNLDRNKLIWDLMNLHQSNKCYDVTFRCNGSEFKAHKAILSARSPVFSAMFEHDTMENKTNIVSIEDISGCTMKKLLAFMYGRDLDNTLTVESCADLYIAADKYGILELKQMCVRFMSLNLNAEMFSKVALLADLHQDSNLFEATRLFVKKNISRLMISKEWINLCSEYYEVAKKLMS